MSWAARLKRVFVIETTIPELFHSGLTERR